MRFTRSIVIAIGMGGACVAVGIGCSSSDPPSSAASGDDASCGTSADAIAPSGDDASDASFVDASEPMDAAGATDAAADAAPDVATIVACSPANVGSSYVPPEPIDPICSPSQFAGLSQSCILAFDQTACNQACAAAPVCCRCIFPNNGSPPGPFVYTQHNSYVNYAGCVAVELGSTYPGCGAAMGDRNTCVTNACDSCWVADAGSLDGGDYEAYVECTRAAFADGGACAPYLDNWTTACPSHSPAYVTCSEGANETYTAWASRIAALFCLQ